MRFLHTMIRVYDLDAALTFFCQHLGLQELRRTEVPQGRFTLVFLATGPGAPGSTDANFLPFNTITGVTSE